ncbi:MAG: hypothetical protein R3B49_07415 [Phycisphaerales bacterium]
MTQATIRSGAGVTPGAHDTHHEDLINPAPLPLGHRVANILVITLPFVALIGAIAHAWGWGIGWTELSLLLGMYLLTGFGVTIGYHRLFTHKAFKTGKVMTAVLGVLGSMSVEGSILHWCAFHRCHHQHSDHAEDPHSPHGHGPGLWGLLKGFWHGHMGWMIDRSSRGLDHYVPDLRADPLVRWLAFRLFPGADQHRAALPCSAG